jgi:hypothetical protein
MRRLGCLLVVAIVGCGGGAAQNPPASEIPVVGPGGLVPETPPPGQTPPGTPPGGPLGEPQKVPGVFNVTITNQAGQFLIDALEIEFNRRRGIHTFFGFYRDAYHQPANIPFEQLERVDFRGMMPPELFDQAMIGREDLNLSRDVAFELTLTYKDQRQELFYAFIPKIRGIFDFKPWEVGMANNSLGIQIIEFNR